MASIADVFFTARLDDGTLNVQAQKAGDKAGMTLGQRMSSGIKGASKNIFAGLAIGGGIAAFGLIDKAISSTIGFLGDAKDAALEEERSIAKLDAALKANVESWDGNRDAIEDVLESRMRLGFADDEQRDSLAKLVSVTKDSTKALELQRIAMDLARLRGMDLSTAGDLIGKVYGGNIGILSRYGIQLKKGTSATEALAEIQRRAAGQAEAYANTNEGKLLASQIKVGEAMERLGAEILPILADGMVVVADVAIEVVDALTAIANSPVGDALGFIGETAANAAKGLGFLTDGLEESLDIMTPWDGTANTIVGDTKRMGQSFRDVAGSISSTGGQIEGAFDGVGDSSGDMARDVRHNARETLESIQALRSGALDDAQAAIDALYGPIELAADREAKMLELREVRVAMAAKDVTKAELAELQVRRDEIGRALLEIEAEFILHGTKAEQISKLSAFLASDFWRQAYEDALPEQRIALDQWRATLQDRLNGMTEDARTGGGKLVDSYTGEIIHGKDSVTQGAKVMVSGINGVFQTTNSNAYGWGKGTGKAYADGLESTYGYVQGAAQTVASAVSSGLKASSPPVATSPLHDIPLWGQRTIESYADGLLEGVRAVLDATKAVAGGVASGLALSPQAPRWSLAGAVSVPSMGAAMAATGTVATPPAAGRVNNIHVEVQGLLKAESAFEVATTLQRFGDRGLFDGDDR